MYSNGIWDEEGAKILQGKQIALVRSNRCFNVGDTFQIQFAKYHIIAVFRRTMEFTTSRLHDQFGFKTQQEMIDWWNLHNEDIPYKPDNTFYLHYFEEVKK